MKIDDWPKIRGISIKYRVEYEIISLTPWFIVFDNVDEGCFEYMQTQNKHGIVKLPRLIIVHNVSN